MPLYKITESINVIDSDLPYYGCPVITEDGVVYADVPDYAVESYIEVGRIFDVQCCADKAPEVKKTKEEPKADSQKSAEDVVEGKTEDAQEKKRKRRNKAEIAADKAAAAAATLADADDMFGL